MRNDPNPLFGKDLRKKCHLQCPEKQIGAKRRSPRGSSLGSSSRGANFKSKIPTGQLPETSSRGVGAQRLVRRSPAATGGEARQSNGGPFDSFDKLRINKLTSMNSVQAGASRDFTMAIAVNTALAVQEVNIHNEGGGAGYLAPNDG